MKCPRKTQFQVGERGDYAFTKACPHKGLKAAGAPVMLKSDHDRNFIHQVVAKKDVSKKTCL